MKAALTWIRAHLSLVAIAILLVIILAGGFFHSCERDRWRDQYIEALNAAALADSTRLVYQDSVTSIYETLILILEEKELVAMELEAERRLREKQGYDLKAIYELYASARGQIVGLTTARADRDTTRIRFSGRDGPIAMGGEVAIASALVHPGAAVRYTLGAVIDSLRIRIRQLEDPRTGRVLIQATSPQPQVTNIKLEGAIEVQQTTVGQKPGPSRLKWFLTGGAVVALASVLLPGGS